MTSQADRLGPVTVLRQPEKIFRSKIVHGTSAIHAAPLLHHVFIYDATARRGIQKVYPRWFDSWPLLRLCGDRRYVRDVAKTGAIRNIIACDQSVRLGSDYLQIVNFMDSTIT